MMISSLLHQNLQGRGKLLSVWLITLLFIPLLSFYGRPLQLFLLSQVSEKTLGGYMGLLFCGFIIGYTIMLMRSGFNPYVWHLLWIAVVFFFLFQHLPYVEKVHVAVFGVLGFLSRRLFSLTMTIGCCVVVSLLDETFQYFLATRVGDLRDVGVNISSSLLGLFLAFLLHESEQRNHSRGQDRS